MLMRFYDCAVNTAVFMYEIVNINRCMFSCHVPSFNWINSGQIGDRIVKLLSKSNQNIYLLRRYQVIHFYQTFGTAKTITKSGWYNCEFTTKANTSARCNRTTHYNTKINCVVLTLLIVTIFWPKMEFFFNYLRYL